MISVTGARFGTVELASSSNEGGRVAYASYGAEDAPAVMVLGGISAHRFVCGNEDGTPGWWPGVVGPGAPLDPESYRVIGIDYIGGAGGSSVPTSGPGVPVVTTADQADGVEAVLYYLGIDKLHAFIGAPSAGMLALALGAHHPDRLAPPRVFCAPAASPCPTAPPTASTARSAPQPPVASRTMAPRSSSSTLTAR